MRVVVADPPAFTPLYDHELAAALAGRGRTSSSSRRGSASARVAAPDGYRRRELFYPLSSRLFGRSRLRVPLKVLEHPFGAGAARRHAGGRRPRPVAGRARARPWLLRHRAPLVFTAHDLLPRRTAAKTGLWRGLFGRFERIVVHSQRGRETLAAFGVPEDKLRVIPHPVMPSDPARARRRPDGARPRPRSGRTSSSSTPRRRRVLAPCRGDTACASPRRRGARSSPRREIDRALGEATVAVFPYRAELDQTGALLRALGAGVPAVVYDVGGLAEPVRAFGAGRVVPPDDVDGLAAAIRELVDDAAALAEARAGRAAGARGADVGRRPRRPTSTLYRELA